MERLISEMLFRIRHLEPPWRALTMLAAGPVLMGASRSSPPWPDGAAGVTALLAVGLALSLARARTLRPRSATAAVPSAIVMITVSLAAGLCYALIMTQFTFVIPTTGELGVKGFICTADATLIYPNECPGDDLEALRSAEYESDRIWQRWTVNAVRIGILVTWLALWCGLASLSTLVARQPFQALIARAPPTAEANSCHFFVSYAHADLQQLLPILQLLHLNQYPLWFDKGLSGGRNWDADLANRIRGCRALIVFLSPASMASAWVEREVQLADNLGKTIFAVRIGDVALSPSLSIRLAASQIVEGTTDHIISEFVRTFPSNCSHLT